MGFWRGKKLGDTLVEVTIAIGIFSLVAIAVVSVVSNSTSSAQSNLENTVTREEIDAQAEAIRFIHDSYIMDTSASNDYKDIWTQIEDKAIEAKGTALEAIENYAPTSCEAPFKFTYNGANYDYSDKAFVINYNALSTLDKNNIVKSLDGANYKESQTFPRIAYSTGDNSLSGENNLDGTFNHAEGIFVLAVKDPGSSYTSEAGEVKKSSAYIDFYIRTCWYAANANTPTTISTIIRLTDTKDEREAERGYDSAAAIVYHQTTKSGEGDQSEDTQDVVSGHTKYLRTYGFDRDTGTAGWSFVGKWCYDENRKLNTSPIVFPSTTPGQDAFTTCKTNRVFTAGSGFEVPKSEYNNKYHFYEMLKLNPAFYVKYDANKEYNGGVCQYYRGKIAKSVDCLRNGEAVNGGEKYTPTIVSNTRNSDKYYNYFAGADNSYNFVGWCTVKTKLLDKDANYKDVCEKSYAGTYYKGTGGEQLKSPNPTPVEGGEIVLFAMWQRKSINITYKPGDYGRGKEKSISEYGQGGDAPSHTVKAYNDSAIGFTPENCYVFKRWKGDNGAYYKAGDTITTSRTLTAEWDYNCYNVEYHANYDGGGSYGVAKIQVGKTHTVLANMFNRQGFQWTGWKNASGNVVNVNSKISSNANTTYHLYAQWKNVECKLHDQHFGEITKTPGGYIFQYEKQVAPGTSTWQDPGKYAWTVPEGCGGLYQFEVWGARGGTDNRGNTSGNYGGAGGFATGYARLYENQTIYVVIGGKGGENAGGYNGGGRGNWGGGGGATHIATNLRGDGQLFNYEKAVGEVLIVAGGGGGGASFSDFTGWFCPGGNYAGDQQHTEQLNPGAHATGGKGGGASGHDGENADAHSTNPFGTPMGSGLRPECANWTFSGDRWNSSWGDDGTKREPAIVAGCGEVFVYNAAGGKSNAGGRGGWGTDHWDPPIRDENGNLIYGQVAVCDANGNNCNFTELSENYNGVTNHGHDNIIGGMGSFGKGGTSYKMIYAHQACGRSDFMKNQVKRTCNLFDSNKAQFQYILNPYGVDINKYTPGSVEDTGSVGGGGGGGWYGGGAGGVTGCRPGSGAGGSGYTGGVSNPEYKDYEMANYDYGAAVIRRVSN